MTKSRMAIQAEESRVDQKVEGFKHWLADELALEPIDDLVELEEIVEEAEGDEEEETTIWDCHERLKKKEEKEKEIKEEEEKEKEIKEEEEKEKEIKEEEEKEKEKKLKNEKQK